MTPSADTSRFQSFCDVIALWPTPAVMAEQIGAPVATVRKWAQRDRIPDEWWSAILKTSVAEWSNLTAEVLVELAACKALEARP